MKNSKEQFRINTFSGDEDQVEVRMNKFVGKDLFWIEELRDLQKGFVKDVSNIDGFSCEILRFKNGTAIGFVFKE